MKTDVETRDGSWIEDVIEQPGEVKAGRVYHSNQAKVTFGDTEFDLSTSTASGEWVTLGELRRINDRLDEIEAKYGLEVARASAIGVAYRETMGRYLDQRWHDVGYCTPSRDARLTGTDWPEIPSYQWRDGETVVCEYTWTFEE